MILLCLSRVLVTEHISHPAQHFLQEELTQVGRDRSSLSCLLLIQLEHALIQRLFDKANQDQTSAEPWCSFVFLLTWSLWSEPIPTMSSNGEQCAWCMRECLWFNGWLHRDAPCAVIWMYPLLTVQNWKKKLQKSESSQEIQGQAQRDYREGGETAVC